MLTRILIGINVIAYIWELSVGVPAASSQYGMYGPAIVAGQWWRIVTGSFLHESLLHIGFNMLALWQCGTMCELLFGSRRTFVLYVVSMFGAGAAIVQFSYADPTIGASGAIFGLFGALAAAGLRLGRRGRPIVSSSAGVIVVNIIYGLTQPNISMSGHIGGAICGFIVGYALVPRRVLHPPPVAPVFHPNRSEPETIEGEVIYDSAKEHAPKPSPPL